MRRAFDWRRTLFWGKRKRAHAEQKRAKRHANFPCCAQSAADTLRPRGRPIASALAALIQSEKAPIESLGRISHLAATSNRDNCCPATERASLRVGNHQWAPTRPVEWSGVESQVLVCGIHQLHAVPQQVATFQPRSLPNPIQFGSIGQTQLAKLNLDLQIQICQHTKCQPLPDGRFQEIDTSSSLPQVSAFGALVVALFHWLPLDRQVESIKKHCKWKHDTLSRPTNHQQLAQNSSTQDSFCGTCRLKRANDTPFAPV